ncbi:MAG: glycerol-3-phosphate 1-O-acyltransferase PlsY [FCB group bacterium]|nr:glycerol-3-phosphate 1-O-acyltransferase PlsY [FCB group bacterium]
MLTVAIIVFAYLIGSVPFGLIVSRIAGAPDIRKTGSGNIGATNVWRVCGFKTAIWVFVGDIGKGVLAVLLARYFTAHYELAFFARDVFLVICALAAVMGHVFPIYLSFKGGKGVNTALGTMATLLPRETLISFVVFVIVVFLFRYISLGSIIAAISLFVAVAVEKYFLHYNIAMIYFYLSLALAILIIITHRKNIGRLVAGKENRFSFSGKAKVKGVDV